MKNKILAVIFIAAHLLLIPLVNANNILDEIIVLFALIGYYFLLKTILKNDYEKM